MLASLDDAFESPTSVTMTSLSPPPRRGSKRVSTPDKEKLEAEVLRSPHNVPSFMDIRNGHGRRAREDDSAIDVSFDLDVHSENPNDDDDDYAKVKSDDDDPHHPQEHDDLKPAIQVHEAAEADDHDLEFSPQSPASPLSPLTDDTMTTATTTTGFNLSPPARPQRLGDTASVISLVDVNI